MKRYLDILDKKILNIISKNARVPFLEVARECGVSGAAIHQRVQKLIGSGVIKGSEFIVDTYKIGYQTCAYIGINISDMTYYKNVITALEAIPEIVECHATTGRYVLLIKVFAHNNRHLGNIIMDKIVSIKGVTGTETLQVSLEEVLRRQIDKFDAEDESDTEEPDDDKENIIE
ncbi:MAG: Lrp/AsnC ligand binding domain-containing protein [Prevotellaceae bacterium]|jgi:Lrp/AsnC family transcriptional regulator for asnA, asnC and gidA|nr:Lrp/AsnC ligand binding domain-containing protein [Prevotellaceae bacterium]